MVPTPKRQIRDRTALHDVLNPGSRTTLQWAKQGHTLGTGALQPQDCDGAELDGAKTPPSNVNSWAGTQLLFPGVTFVFR